MNNQLIITEIFWLRSLACLAVTLGHAIHSGYIHFVESSIYHGGIYLINMSIFFGVPVFIFISEFLLANKYLYYIPKGFIKKRLKILVLPYLFMNIVFALLHVETWTLQAFVIRLAENILLGYTAVYFIPIIFQFYFLHLLLRKYLNRISAKLMITIAFIINFLYLAFFNFVPRPNGIIADYMWETGYWMPFVGWFFYFVLGFYCGKNYDVLIKVIRTKWILIMPIFTFIILLLVNRVFELPYHSKRVDMLVYSASIIFLIMNLSSSFKRVPRIIMFISNYSFSIFLLNQFFFSLIILIKPPEFLNIFTYSISVFVITLSLCIITTYVFNQFRYGKYLVGKIMLFRIEDSETRQDAVVEEVFNKQSEIK